MNEWWEESMTRFIPCDESIFTQAPITWQETKDIRKGPSPVDAEAERGGGHYGLYVVVLVVGVFYVSKVII